MSPHATMAQGRGKAARKVVDPTKTVIGMQTVFGTVIPARVAQQLGKTWGSPEDRLGFRAEPTRGRWCWPSESCGQQ